MAGQTIYIASAMDVFVERQVPGHYYDTSASVSLLSYAYACFGLSIGLSSSFVWARIYTKAFIIGEVGWDDSKNPKEIYVLLHP